MKKNCKKQIKKSLELDKLYVKGKGYDSSFKRHSINE